MKSRLERALVAVAISTMLLSGCSPDPAPSSSTAEFATEQEAFAAAEQTYRNYVDALNQVDLSDPETFEPVYEWTTGEANAAARKTFSQMHADGWMMSGRSVIDRIEPLAYTNSGDAAVEMAVCLDVSNISGVDAEGNSIVSADRRDTQSMLVSFIQDADSTTGLLVAGIEGREGEPSCVD